MKKHQMCSQGIKAICSLRSVWDQILFLHCLGHVFPQSTLDTFSLCWRKMEQFLGEREEEEVSIQTGPERKKRKTWSVYGLPLFSVFHPPWWLRKHVVNNGSWGLYDIRVGGYDSTIFFTAMTLHARKMSEAKLCSYSEHLHLQAWLKCMLCELMP